LGFVGLAEAACVRLDVVLRGRPGRLRPTRQ
jgi:hypothetical protein